MPQNDLTGADTVTICMPVSLEYVRILRLTTSGMATRLGFDVEGIDDLRIAVDELASAVIGAATGPTLEVTLCARDGELRIEGRAGVPADCVVALDDLSNRILKAVSDDFGVEVAGTTARFWCARPIPGPDR